MHELIIHFFIHLAITGLCDCIETILHTLHICNSSEITQNPPRRSLVRPSAAVARLWPSSTLVVSLLSAYTLLSRALWRLDLFSMLTSGAERMVKMVNKHEEEWFFKFFECHRESPEPGPSEFNGF